MSVLSPVNATSLTKTLLLRQVKAFFETRVNTAGKRIIDSSNQKVNGLERLAQPWRVLKEGLTEPLRQLDRVVGRLDSIDQSIENLLKQLDTADKDEEASTNAAGYRVAFDGILSSLRRTAESALDSPNLLGRQVPSKLSYPISPTRVTQTVNGTYMGSDYYIVDSEGKRWQPDRDGKMIRRYDSYPDAESGKKANLETGLRLDSFDSETDSITFTADSATAAIQSFSGTVVREGLAILDGWLYDGLSTQEGRDRARADLLAARTVVGLEKRRYEIAASTVNFHRSRADQNLEGFEKKKEAALVQQAQQLADAKDELNRQFLTAQDSLSGTIALRTQYTQFFLGYHNTEQHPLFAALIDINA